MPLVSKPLGLLPRPLDIPPFDVKGTKMVLGEEGTLYKQLIAS